ncbi:MAG: hypothetical protein ACHQ53_19270 [Polyangiales bacterium]
MRAFEVGLGAACLLFIGCNTQTDQARQVSSGAATAGAPQPVAQAASDPSGTLPCEVSAVAQQHCQLCHASTPLYGAPMPLVTFADFHKPAKSDASRQVYELVGQRIHAQTNAMPPLTQPQLMATELSMLDTWIGAGAPSGSQTTCATQPASTGAAGTGATASGTTPAPLGPSGTTTATTAPSSDEQCFTFTAFGATKGTPYSVPSTPDYYNCFNFSRPFPSDALGVRFMSIIDNRQAIHHWIIYGTTADGGDGVSAECTGAHPDGTFLAGWAPGTPDRVMPPDVGMLMPGQGLQLEIHYNAPSAGMTDASGVQICVSRTPRAHVAGIHPLGQEGFATTGPDQVVGNCVPKGPFPITILTSDPHMHKKGTRMSTIINRADGTQTTLIDKPFDFNSQILYDTPAVVNAGDTLTTTCYYDAPATFGHGTMDEMCYNFVLAYPAGALAGGAGLSHNGNLCIDDPQFAAVTH